MQRRPRTPLLRQAVATQLRTDRGDRVTSVLWRNANGATVARYEYDAWGDVRSETVSVPALTGNRYLFQGREYSHATGFCNCRARWYDPATGRWLSKDPIGLSGGLNLYEFCGNDPVDFSDPAGLDVGKNAEKWAKKKRRGQNNTMNGASEDGRTGGGLINAICSLPMLSTKETKRK